MVRRKIAIKRIENASSRHVTFSKRRAGFLKKAHDLSVLCDADIAAIIFSSQGKLFQFASSSMESILDKYAKCNELLESPNMLHKDLDDHSVDKMTKDTDKLKMSHRSMTGDDLETLSLKDLIHLEQHIHDSIGRIRTKKAELLIGELDELNEKVTDHIRATSSRVSRPAEAGASRVTDSVESNNLGQQCSPTNLQEMHKVQSALQLWTEPGDQSNNSAPKRPRIREDLNRSPQWRE